MPYDTTKEENEAMGGAEDEEGGAVEEQEGGETEGPDPGSEGGNENSNGNRRDGGRGRKGSRPPLRFQTYREAVKKYCLHHTDNNMVGGLAYRAVSSKTVK